jgi:hypothetical protein
MGVLAREIGREGAGRIGMNGIFGHLIGSSGKIFNIER